MVTEFWFFQYRTMFRIYNRLWSPGIDSEESISPTYVAWQAGATRLFGNRFMGSLKDLQIRAQGMV
jgi:hypothetical protein